MKISKEEFKNTATYATLKEVAVLLYGALKCKEKIEAENGILNEEYLRVASHVELFE